MYVLVTVYIFSHVQAQRFPVGMTPMMRPPGGPPHQQPPLPTQQSATQPTANERSQHCNSASLTTRFPMFNHICTTDCLTRGCVLLNQSNIHYCKNECAIQCVRERDPRFNKKASSKAQPLVSSRSPVLIEINPVDDVTPAAVVSMVTQTQVTNHSTTSTVHTTQAGQLTQVTDVMTSQIPIVTSSAITNNKAVPPYDPECPQPVAVIAPYVPECPEPLTSPVEPYVPQSPQPVKPPNNKILTSPEPISPAPMVTPEDSPCFSSTPVEGSPNNYESSDIYIPSMPSIGKDERKIVTTKRSSSSCTYIKRIRRSWSSDSSSSSTDSSSSSNHDTYHRSVRVYRDNDDDDRKRVYRDTLCLRALNT